jgi:hypothetical protein
LLVILLLLTYLFRLGDLKKALLHFQMQRSVFELKSGARKDFSIHGDQRSLRQLTRFRIHSIYAQRIPLAPFRQSDRDLGHCQIAVLYRRLHVHIL